MEQVEANIVERFGPSFASVGGREMRNVSNGRAVAGAIKQRAELIMVTDRDGLIEFVNREFEEASGYAGREIMGRNPSFLKSGQHDDATYRRLWKTILQGEVYRGELINRRKDGRLFRESKAIFPLTDGHGTIARFVAVGTDITERSKQQDGIGSMGDFSVLANVIPGFVYRTSPNERAETHFFGENISQITGFSVEELSKTGEFPVGALMSAADRERRRLEVSQAAADARPFKVEYAIRRRNGTIVHVLDCGLSTSYRDDASPNTYGVVLDVSDRKLLEHRLHASEDVRNALSAELLCVLENERKRIASELHDDIGQILTSVKMRIEGAISSISTGDLVTGQRILAEVVPTIKGAMEEVRRISLDLRPPMIDDLGIVATMGWFCREFSLSPGSPRVELDVRIDERDIPEPLKIVIYRVLQEAMNNIIKHAGAEVARVRLLRPPHNLELIIEDDGCGFDAAQTSARGSGMRGSGFTNMRGRVESAGGSLSLETIKGAGTIVRAMFPCKP